MCLLPYLKYTRTVTYIDNQEIVRLTPEGLHIYNVDEEELEKKALPSTGMRKRRKRPAMSILC